MPSYSIIKDCNPWKGSSVKYDGRKFLPNGEEKIHYRLACHWEALRYNKYFKLALSQPEEVWHDKGITLETSDSLSQKAVGIRKAIRLNKQYWDEVESAMWRVDNGEPVNGKWLCDNGYELVKVAETQLVPANYEGHVCLFEQEEVLNEYCQINIQKTWRARFQLDEIKELEKRASELEKRSIHVSSTIVGFWKFALEFLKAKKDGISIEQSWQETPKSFRDKAVKDHTGSLDLIGTLQKTNEGELVGVDLAKNFIEILNHPDNGRATLTMVLAGMTGHRLLLIPDTIFEAKSGDNTRAPHELELVVDKFRQHLQNKGMRTKPDSLEFPNPKDWDCYLSYKKGLSVFSDENWEPDGHEAMAMAYAKFEMDPEHYDDDPRLRSEIIRKDGMKKYLLEYPAKYMRWYSEDPKKRPPEYSRIDKVKEFISSVFPVAEP